jgi:hypothetical protein
MDQPTQELHIGTVSGLATRQAGPPRHCGHVSADERLLKPEATDPVWMQIAMPRVGGLAARSRDP